MNDLRLSQSELIESCDDAKIYCVRHPDPDRKGAYAVISCLKNDAETNALTLSKIYGTKISIDVFLNTIWLLPKSATERNQLTSYLIWDQKEVAA